MLPPTPIRRLLLVPLVIVIAAALTVLTPPVALLSAVLNLIRRPTRPGRVRHSRLLRVIFLGLAWSAGETAALTVFLGLWIASGFGGRLDTEPYQTRHYEVMEWFLDLIYRAAGRACGLTVTGPPDEAGADGRSDEAGADGPPEAAGADGPPEAAGADGRSEAAGADGPPEASGVVGRPLIVFSRHAGPGDSLLLVHYLLSVCERRPRIVMKATLQLDPSVDILANRLPNAFLRRAKAKAAARTSTNPGSRTVAADPHHVDQIRRLAAGLDGRGALVLFPEGGNWTPVRWRRAISRLRRGGRPDLAERAAAMPNVLPPHASGALAAIAACPAADVIFVAHTGLDRLVSVRDVWRSLLTDMEVRAHWWHVPAASVPHAASREAQLSWLYDWWEQIDAWITAENPAPGLGAANPEAPDPGAPDPGAPDPGATTPGATTPAATTPAATTPEPAEVTTPRS